jgi:hypothetical protein
MLSVEQVRSHMPLVHCSLKLHALPDARPSQRLSAGRQVPEQHGMKLSQVKLLGLQHPQVSGSRVSKAHGRWQMPPQMPPSQVHLPAWQTPLRHCSPHVHASNPFRPSQKPIAGQLPEQH